MEPHQRTVLAHPDLIPIQYRTYPSGGDCAQPLDDIRLRFVSDKRLSIAGFLEITIRTSGETETFVAQEVCTDAAENGYDTEVRFLTREDAYRARMVEQICHIEAYQTQVQRDEGRHLLIDCAAEEWILAHASLFPSF